MSDLRIALVAEGKTDYFIIEAVLRAILGNRTFILTQLQPENNATMRGEGWAGVVKWCTQEKQRQEEQPRILPCILSLDCYCHEFEYDCLIIHIDGDVAGFEYSDADLSAVAEDQNFSPLPCVQDPCPPIAPTISNLVNVIKSWLGSVSLGNTCILCIPAQSLETWLAAAKWGRTIPYKSPHTVCECLSIDLQTNRPKNLKIRKTVMEYKKHAFNITNNWGTVKNICNQAKNFETEVLRVIP